MLGKMILPRLEGPLHDVGGATPKRTAHACERCRALKAKCTGGSKCDKCVIDKADCRYGDGKRERNKK
jgi:Fungal Zn(2)-Cys(6) binuclear cluster domain